MKSRNTSYDDQPAKGKPVSQTSMLGTQAREKHATGTNVLKRHVNPAAKLGSGGHKGRP